MAAKCPSCNRQGREIDFNIYQCKCGIEWTEPMIKRSLLAKRPGWFTRNRMNLKKFFIAILLIFLFLLGVSMTMKPAVVI